MNKKNLIVLSIACLLGIVGCGNQPAAPTSSSEEPSSSVSSEEGEGTIVISENLPAEIAKGNNKALDLEKYVEVSGVSSWSVESDSKCIRIDGHSIIGLSYDDFEATIVAGKTRKTISGSVVSPEKVAFNALVDSLKQNYSYYSEYTGFGFVNPNWYLEMYKSYQSDTATYYLLDGAIRRSSMSDSYHIQLNSATDSAGNFTFADELDVIKGSAKSLDARGFGEFGYSSKDFQFQIDREGDPTGYFILENSDSDQYGNSDVSDLITRITGDEDLWISMMYYITGNIRTKMNLAASYRDGFLIFYPCTEAGLVVKTMSVGGEEYSTYVSVSNVNECDIEACSAWLENPVYPAKISTAPIRDFFKAANAAKGYSRYFYGTWYNPETEETVDVPDSFKDEKGNALFPNYAAYSVANENIVERYVTKIGKAASAFEDEDMPKAGDADVHFVHDNYLYTAKGTLADGTRAYEEAKKADEPFSETGSGTIWESTLIPYYLLNEGKIKLIANCSFYEYEEKEDGSKVYYWNDYGNDTYYGYVGLSGLPYLGSMDCLGMIPLTPSYYIGANEWYRYCEVTLTIAANYAQYNVTFAVGSDAYYKLGWITSGIGEDAVSSEAKAVYASIAA